MKTLAASVLLGLVAFAAAAQEPATVDFTSYGDTGASAAEQAADSLGAELVLRDLSDDDLALPACATCKSVPRGELPALLAVALGLPVALHGKVVTVYLPLTATPGGRVKGYDVSVPGGRFVEYVNTYGAPRSEPRAGKEEPPERTGAEHLATVLEDLLYDPRGQRFEASVVGDRLLYTLDDGGHAAVREALDLLIAEKGGESASLKAERALIEKLKGVQFTGDLTGTPVFSVISGICGTAGVGVVLGRDLGAIAGEWHIDFAQTSAVSAWEALERVFALLRTQEYPVEFTARGGVAALELEGSGIQRGYRVYELSELLKKLAASYQRQRTAPGKEDGFSGDIKAHGGVSAVSDALEEQLSASGVLEGVQIEAYGTRLIVRGGALNVDAATDVLKEMGWEE